METDVRIPCTVAARALWRTPYAPALVHLAPNRQRLIWAARNDLLLDPQSATAEELTAMLVVKLVREEKDKVVVALRTRGTLIELSLAKELLSRGAGSV